MYISSNAHYNSMEGEMCGQHPSHVVFLLLAFAAIAILYLSFDKLCACIFD